jgi:hypothetical protein
MRPFSFTLLIVLLLKINSLFAGETIERYTAHFNHDADKLTKTELLKLQEQIAALGLDDAYEVTITGHTDKNGSSDYNNGLSERRSKFIFYSLLHFGLDEELVSIDWKGESALLDRSATDQANAKNRRVDIEIKRYTFESTEDLQSALSSSKTQVFVINPEKKNLLFGNDGVQVSIPPSAFVDENGNPVNGEVTIQMKEALSFGSFHDYNLSTTAGNQMLETGGMVYLEARDEDNQLLGINEDAAPSMMLPSNSKEDGMELFTSTDGSDWQQIGQQPLTPTWSRTRDVIFYGGPLRPVWNFIPPQLTLDRRAPVKPSEPKKPRKPHKPRPENYVVEPTFINKLFWKSKNEKAKAKLASHTADYQRKLVVYEEKLEAYLKLKEAYPEKVADYECALEDWTQYKLESYLNFKKSEKYLSALRVYEQHYLAQMERYDEQREQWLCDREYMAIEMGEKADESSFTNRQTMDNYVFTLNKLGWINCDRFLGYSPNLLTKLEVEDPDTSKEVVLLVFNDVKSMIGLRRTEGGYAMQNFPLNEEAEIFAYKVVDGKPMVCHKNVRGKKSDELEFKPSSFKEIKGILQSFDEGRVPS